MKVQTNTMLDRIGGGLSRVLRVGTSLLFAALVITVLWGVLSRYVLGTQSRWTEEVAIYLLIWVSLLGAPLAYREGAHLGLDYLVSKFDPAARLLGRIMVEGIVLLTSLFAFVYGGSRLVGETLASNQLSPVMGWNVGYLYLAVPLCGLFFSLFAIERLAGLLRTGKGEVAE